VRLSLADFRRVLRECGLGLIGQTREIAPADRMLYALRDVTATVSSMPLISASIMSKKMAEGIDALVLDVKCGDGAFLRTREQAGALATTMLGIGRGMGKRVAALLTDMEQPLGRTVGNALEVAECVETLKGRGPTDLESLSVELAAWMVHLAGAAAGLDAARARVREALASGAGLERFRRVVELQGGDPRVCDDPASVLPRSRETVVVRAERDGRVARLAARAIGDAGMLLGAGRETVDGPIDPAVGFVFHKKVGDPVAVNEPIVTAHVGKASRREEALARLREAILVAPEAPARGPLVLDILA
jgi:pyrimidine-nucleoside phosphorylase